MTESLDIAEVARRTGLTARALRFYEARGLVTPLRTASGRRHYGPAELERVHQILALKRAGLSLAQIQRIAAGRRLDLRALITAQIASLTAQAREIADARTRLSAILSRIDRSEPIDVATFCSLIRDGESTMNTQTWRTITDQYLTEDAKDDFATAHAALPADFDQERYAAQWADLGARIKGALPLDPAGEEAQALLREWEALLAPFQAVATPAMMQGVTRLYNDMESWHGTGEGKADPGFDAAVFRFIQEAARAGRA
ncbi:MerR family transcriptional regulator [Sphingobium sp. SYK-6]|uniref:MerR family transcriptional regulator n=1 Tax=Sphingobium sp. (strain NBRC 103272 / SYK-6) TaxID=627192 RepID=UPI0002276DDA|nr:MerR family transcriptional regulator [Sphingobium sp. SYK-6]BAK64997.1 MerR family transcriptional regulator [Sphingobium sp. SYK-6]